MMATPTRVYSEPFERNRRLRHLALALDGGTGDARFGLLEVVRAVVAGRANSTDNNARSSGGYNAWDYGVRRLREVFRRVDDWEKFEENGVEGIINPPLRLKVTVISTDTACDRSLSPRNRTPKGPAHEKIVDLNQAELFERTDAVKPSNGWKFWELCVADDGNRVGAELSLPVLFESNYLLHFSERIFLIDPDEWEKIKITLPDDAEGADFEPAVRRK